MRVLENNNYIEIICVRCGSKLAVNVEDIKYHEIHHHCSAEFYVCCGACGRRTGVDSSRIPKTWIRKIISDDF